MPVPDGMPVDGVSPLPPPAVRAPHPSIHPSVLLLASGFWPAAHFALPAADGHLYEVQYGTADGWRTKRCSLVCHTGTLRRLLPSFLPSLLFGAPSALVELLADDHRHILYARSQASGIQVGAAPTTACADGAIASGTF